MKSQGTFPTSLARLLHVLGLILYLGVPQGLAAHGVAEDHAPRHAGAAHVEALFASGEEMAGQCHPGLDCISAGIVIRSPGAAASDEVTSPTFHLSADAGQSWLPAHEPPPPRD